MAANSIEPVIVETAKGGIPLDRLGVTLMHEHVFVLSTEIQENNPQLWNEQEQIDGAVAKLNAAAERGVDTIVDLTVLGQGRYLPRIKKVAERVALNIVVATGVYTYNDEPMYFAFRGPGRVFEGPDPMVELFVRDITEGIGDTGVKAAVLKCATETEHLPEGVERVLRATAQAHRETGAPIQTHSNALVRNGLLQQKVFREEGVDLSRVVIGHSGDSDDLDYLRELLDAGSFLGMDRFGMEFIAPLDQRVETVAQLVREGYAGQLVLSHDCPCFLDYLTTDQRELVAPSWDYTHIHDDVLPALRKAEVSDEDLRTMLVDNPRRFFAANAPY
ncbi:phosphotriesterase family protein [Streptomyces justiciae]|uniref:Phosphotriesterase-related protein n=1 Tax=Streptomyces justiciae TaxID=2780140 RepID=A0ABU3LJ99_9ACTN|nr:phosphotriesterase-related protein [Streptomyces justiciae]MCW8375469.1 phosphotriesterase-related protein [Streptomyces justiciae]MDT7839316.1 phosphotriesterase-related protein [Streptomyces justiciae]